jgi:DMSO/TMAO reductase YedYZ molybdopterin-dependent catalytic subunit
LQAGDRTFTLADLEALPQTEIVAVLDCTGLWYAEQRWQGVRLDRLIDAGDARSVRVGSFDRYSRRYPARTCRTCGWSCA